MVVERYMTPNPITVRPDTSLQRALELLKSHEIRHLPVLKGKRLVGIITDRDMRHLLPSALAPPDQTEAFRAWGAQVKVGEVMIRQVYTVTSQTRTEKAARLMVEHRIGCLPVLRGATLVGIVTTIDLLRAMTGEERLPERAPEGSRAGRRKPLEARRTPRAESTRVRSG